MALRSDSLNIISLCTGGGGLDRAVELAFPTARPVACVEREAFAVANLVSQMQRGIMAPAPIHGDVRTFPGRRFRGGVDGVIGGIPCQPYSLAGKRLGRNDERDLWSDARRIFVQSGAWFILIENVGGMLSEGGAERVRGDLLRLGCKIEAGLFRASEVGLPHERERLFILGVADGNGEHGYRRGVFRSGWWGQSTDRSRDLADPESFSRHGVGQSISGFGPYEQSPGGYCGILADADGAGVQGRGPDGRHPGQCKALERGSGALGDPQGVGRGKGRAEPIIRRGRNSIAGSDGELAHPHSLGPASVGRDAGEIGGVQEAQRQPEHGSALLGGGGSEVADAVGSGHDGRPCEPEWTEEERAAVEWASYGPLFAPGPGEANAWRWIMERVPERLPAVSRRDLFFHAIRKTRAAADRDPSKRGDLDPQGPFGLRASVVQALAQSNLRRGSHGLATRTDELRLLGNGVVDLEGAYAARSLATDLSPRAAGAARLVRMMNAPAQTDLEQAA